MEMWRPKLKIGKLRKGEQLKWLYSPISKLHTPECSIPGGLVGIFYFIFMCRLSDTTIIELCSLPAVQNCFAVYATYYHYSNFASLQLLKVFSEPLTRAVLPLLMNEIYMLGLLCTSCSVNDFPSAHLNFYSKDMSPAGSFSNISLGTTGIKESR